MTQLSMKYWSLGLVILFSVVFLASPATADEGYTPVSECGTVISAPGHYKLVNDLVGCNVPYVVDGFPVAIAVAVASDNVVLDLDGFSISCAPSDLYPFGVISDSSLRRIKVRNGAISACGTGVLLNQSVASNVEGMELNGNQIGLEVLAGFKNTVAENTMSRNSFTGVFLNSIVFTDEAEIFLGPGVRNRVQRNLLVDNGGFGIDASNIEKNEISCNRMDRNGIVGLNFFAPAASNSIRRNVTNNNLSGGVAVIGFAVDGDVFRPVPDGNFLRANTALGNPNFDLLEGIFDFSSGLFSPNPDGVCLNDWSRSLYGRAIAVPACIAPSERLDRGNGCAPGTDNDTDPGENLLADVSFELQLPPEEGGWILFDPSQSFFTMDRARNGKQSLFHSAFFGVTGSLQETAAEPGSQWRLTGYGLTATPLSAGPVFGIVQFTFFDEFGNDLGTVETAGAEFPALASNQVNAGTPTNQWTFLDTGIGTAPEGTATIQAFTLYVDFSGDPQGVYFDDLKLCALEEDGFACKAF